MSLVVDSSITLARLFEDERPDAADAVMRKVVTRGAVVPSPGGNLDLGRALRPAWCARGKNLLAEAIIHRHAMCC